MLGARTASAIGGVTALLLALAAPAAPAQAATRSWHDQQTPSPRRAGALDSIAVVNARTAWAVGIEDESDPCPGVWPSCPVTAIFHWNGKSWGRQKSPVDFVPVAVAAATAKNAWTVGVTLTGGAVAVHWNGSSWKRTGFPAGSPLGISAGHDGTAYAIGKSAVLSWKHGKWRKVAAHLPAHTALTSVGVRTAKDVWLTGSYTKSGHKYPLVMHYNGKSWKRTAVPHSGAKNATWTAIHPVGPKSVWAVRSPGGSALLHWNGHKWSVKSKIPGGRGVLTVAPDGGKGAWLVPYTTNTATRADYLHWTGARWQRVYGPARNGNAQLGDIAHIPGGRRLMAAGAIQQTTPVKGKYPFLEYLR